jgi:hypothetical protein
MLGHSPATFIPIVDLTKPVFKDLTISSYDKEMLFLLLGAHEGAAYEWEKHAPIAQATGVRPDSDRRRSSQRWGAFSDDERVLLRFGKAIPVQ